MGCHNSDYKAERNLLAHVTQALLVKIFTRTAPGGEMKPLIFKQPLFTTRSNVKNNVMMNHIVALVTSHKLAA